MKTISTSLTRATCMAGALFLAVLGAQAEEPVSTTVEKLDKSASTQGDTKATALISDRFTTFAGSSDNAQSLVTGLRDGSTVTLSATANGQTTTTEFQPATGKLGYGNTLIALSLAQDSLAKAGITQPTAADIQAALNGGTITNSSGQTVALTGVLTMRAAGEGWGDIAHSLNVKLGRIVRDLHTADKFVNKPVALDAHGKPDWAGSMAGGKPDWAGSARPADAGKPTWAGTGKPDTVGAGRPDWAASVMGAGAASHGVGHGKP